MNQPADARFVIDELLESAELRGLVDAERIGVSGFSMGGVTALAVGFNNQHRDERVRAVASLAGGFWDAFGGSYEMEPIPLLLVHGTEDAVSPYSGSEDVYRAAQPPKVLVSIENADHDICQDSGLTDATVETTLAFWDVYLRGNEDARQPLCERRRGTTVRSAGVEHARYADSANPVRAARTSPSSVARL